MKLADKFDSIDCRTDSKARRVLNTAPDTLANVTAEALENGVTLEALEGLNVPVYRYGGQVTIHGKLPDFNPNARPGGYKAVFRNGNGSIGVRYIAIDAEKKALIARAAKVAGWVGAKDSTGFQVYRSFLVRDESEREAQKQAARDALKQIPVARFYGSAYAGCLAYGMGYYVAADIGAIPANEVWPLISDLFKLTPETLAEAEAKEKAEQDAKNAQWDKERTEANAKREQARKTLLASLPAPLTVEPKTPGERFRILDSFSNRLLTVELSGTGKRVFYSITHEDGEPKAYPARKLLGKGWPRACKEGRLFPV